MNEKKLQIIKTSMKLFVEQGFENTPTAQISKESKVATGTLFYHYKTKEELITEIYVYVKKDMAEKVLSDLDYNEDVKISLKKVWVNMLKWGFENKLMNTFLIKFNGSSYISQKHANEAKADFEDVGIIYARGIEQGILRNLGQNLTYGITMNLYNAFLSEFYELGTFDENLLEKSFDIYFNAIKN